MTYQTPKRKLLHTMNTTTKCVASVGASVAAVGAIVLGAWGFASSVGAPAQTEPTPTPSVSVSVEPVVFDDADQLADAVEQAAARKAEAERLAAEQAAADAAAAAQAEADRLAAEQAAADAAARKTSDAGGGDSGGTATAPAPAPTPAPAPEPVKCPAGTVPGQVDGNGNESACQTPCSEWVDTDGDGNAETCARP